MQIVHARINDRDNNLAGARGDVPRLLRQNGARHIVVICPLFGEARIVRLALSANNVVRFRITDVRIGPESCQRLRHGHVRRQSQPFNRHNGIGAVHGNVQFAQRGRYDVVILVAHQNKPIGMLVGKRLRYRQLPHNRLVSRAVQRIQAGRENLGVFGPNVVLADGAAQHLDFIHPSGESRVHHIGGNLFAGANPQVAFHDFIRVKIKAARRPGLFIIGDQFAVHVQAHGVSLHIVDAGKIGPFVRGNPATAQAAGRRFRREDLGFLRPQGVIRRGQPVCFGGQTDMPHIRSEQAIALGFQTQFIVNQPVRAGIGLAGGRNRSHNQNAVILAVFGLHPGQQSPRLAMVPLLVFNGQHGMAVEVHGPCFGRVQRVHRTGHAGDDGANGFFVIGQAVIVGIHHIQTSAGNVLLINVGQTIPVKVLIAIQNAIPVGVWIPRVIPQQILIQIAQAVGIRIAVGSVLPDRIERIKPMRDFPVIGKSVAIAVARRSRRAIQQTELPIALNLRRQEPLVVPVLSCRVIFHRRKRAPPRPDAEAVAPISKTFIPHQQIKHLAWEISRVRKRHHRRAIPHLNLVPHQEAVFRQQDIFRISAIAVHDIEAEVRRIGDNILRSGISIRRQGEHIRHHIRVTRQTGAHGVQPIERTSPGHPVAAHKAVILIPAGPPGEIVRCGGATVHGALAEYGVSPRGHERCATVHHDDVAAAIQPARAIHLKLVNRFRVVIHPAQDAHGVRGHPVGAVILQAGGIRLIQQNIANLRLREQPHRRAELGNPIFAARPVADSRRANQVALATHRVRRRRGQPTQNRGLDLLRRPAPVIQREERQQIGFLLHIPHIRILEGADFGGRAHIRPHPDVIHKALEVFAGANKGARATPADRRTLVRHLAGTQLQPVHVQRQLLGNGIIRRGQMGQPNARIRVFRIANRQPLSRIDDRRSGHGHRDALAVVVHGSVTRFGGQVVTLAHHAQFIIGHHLTIHGVLQRAAQNGRALAIGQRLHIAGQYFGFNRPTGQTQAGAIIQRQE